MAYFLAIDAGGTKTDFLLADENETLARVRTGTVKVLRTDEAAATANFAVAVEELQERTGVRMAQVSRTCIGAAGIGVPMVANSLRHMWSTHIGGELRLEGDVAIALDAAFRGGPGTLALAGTGSNVAGRAQNGTLHTRGGWGPMLADQGSGHAIGSGALHATFLAVDEGRPTLLLDALQKHWELDSREALVEHANRKPVPDVSRLSPVVLACAEAGDTVANEVLATEGERLGYLVRLLLRHFGKLDADGSIYSLAFAGSVMQSVLPVRNALITEVQREFPGCSPLDGVVDPIDGALWRARNEAAFHAPVVRTT